MDMHQRFLIFLCFSAVLGLSGCDRQVSAFKDYLIEKKAEQGDAEAMYQLAMRLKSSDAKRSFEWMLKAADAGHALAQEEAIDRFIRRESPFHDSQRFYQLYNLALDYLHSSAGGNSHAQAFKIFNQLDIHHEGVSYDLAEMYRQGLGTAQNAAKAAALYEQSHQAGNWQASYRLGEMYLNGASGIAQNDQKALYWFKEYQKKMPSGAGDKIALLYARNAHTPAEMKKAMQDLEKLAVLGSQEAIFQLAQFYESGTGTAKNEEQALYWYKRLADRGNPQALEKMGDLYMKGAAGVIKDRQAAYDCYLQAAMRKNRSAEQKMLKLAETAAASQQFELAMSYAEGALSSSLLNQAGTAEKLMNMAAAKGHQQARFYLESERRHQEASRN